MAVCEYGCGRSGQHQFKNKKWCCSKIVQKCPGVKSIIGSFSSGRKHTKETRAKISTNGTGLKRPPRTEEWKNAVSERMKGSVPWNKNLSAEIDERVAKYAESQRGQRRTGNYIANKDWSGSNNPWYGKSRTMDLHPRYNGEIFNREFKNYSNAVHYLTSVTYNQFQNEINPNQLPRKKAGSKGGYQLDHIFPIIEGFLNNIPPEFLAEKTNLQILSWEENLSKSDNLDEEIIPDLIKDFLRNKE